MCVCVRERERERKKEKEGEEEGNNEAWLKSLICFGSGTTAPSCVTREILILTLGVLWQLYPTLVTLHIGQHCCL